MKITSSNPAYIPQPTLRTSNSGLNPAVRPAAASDGFDVPRAAPVNLAPPVANDPPVLSGFDNTKLASPLVLQADGQPKSAKYTFAKLAQQSGVMPHSKAEAEQWFNQSIKPGMEAAGFQVDQVKGDKAFIHTRENPQGEWIDYMKASGSTDRSQQALTWQTQDTGTAGAASGASAAGGGAIDWSAFLNRLIQTLQQLRDPGLTDDQRLQGLQTLMQQLGAKLGTPGATSATGATGTSPAAASVADKPFSQVPGFDFGKLQDLTHVNDKYTPAVRTFSQAIGGLPPVSESLPAIAQYAQGHGFPNAKVAGKDLLDFGDGHGPIDVITNVGGPNSNWWFNNQPG